MPQTQQDRPRHAYNPIRVVALLMFILVAIPTGLWLLLSESSNGSYDRFLVLARVGTGLFISGLLAVIALLTRGDVPTADGSSSLSTPNRDVWIPLVFLALLCLAAILFMVVAG